MNLKNKVLFDYYKDILPKTKNIGPIIKKPTTVAVFISGSRILPAGGDETSDIDLVCGDTQKISFKHAPFLLVDTKHDNLKIHGDYHHPQEIINFNLIITPERMKGIGAGYIDHGYAEPFLLYIHPKGQNFGTLYLDYANDFGKIAVYNIFLTLYNINTFNINEVSLQYNKLTTYLLMGSYKLLNEDPNGDLILLTKRQLYTFGSKEQQNEVKAQIVKVYQYIVQHPFNIAHKELEISNELTQAYMEVEGIHENKPSF